MSYIRPAIAVAALASVLLIAGAFLVADGTSTSSETHQMDIIPGGFENDPGFHGASDQPKPVNDRNNDAIGMEPVQPKTGFEDMMGDMGRMGIEPMKKGAMDHKGPSRDIEVPMNHDIRVDVDSLKEVKEYLEENDGDQEIIEEIQAMIDFETMRVLVESSYHNVRNGKESAEEDDEGIDANIVVEESDESDIEMDEVESLLCVADAKWINILENKTGTKVDMRHVMPIVTADI